MNEVKWTYVAELVSEVYGVYVDLEERFFICPECGEPIYEADYDEFEVIEAEGAVLCPVCEMALEVM